MIFDRSRWIIPGRSDPRWLLAAFLGTYVMLGHFLLSFNRSPDQIVVALVACCALDMLYTWVVSRKLLLPLSAVISGLGLGILFTAPGSQWFMLLASWLAISEKYLITWRGHHLFNPTNLAMLGIVFVSSGQAAIAPAYQWGGYGLVSASVLALGLVVMRRVNKLPMVLSFWAIFMSGALLRSYVLQVPVMITLWAQITSGAFMLYSFFMITDPKTSPATTGGMIVYGIAIGVADLVLQLNTAVYSLFYALAIVTASRGLWFIARDIAALRHPKMERAAATVPTAG
jgi:Na+-translocating ferredoxin:NAD+ oxidoreductase RnfD subunit